MSKETKNNIVPTLRFPEFRDTEEWEKISLIDVADKDIKWSFIGGPFGSNLKSSDYTPNGIRIIQLQNIGDGEFHDDYRIFTSEEKADELLSCNIYPGEIIMSKMGDPVGRACLIPNIHKRYVMCSDGIRLVVDKKRHSKYFIYSLINSPNFRALVEKTATGSTRKRIGLDDLKNLPMLAPATLKEQQKIADCLSSLDEYLTAQGQILEELNAHKKGLMQQLFPGEGEIVPKLRFKEFRDDEVWKKREFDEILEITRLAGYEYSEYWKEDPNREIIALRGYNIGKGKLELKNLAYISNDLSLQLGRSRLFKGDIVYPCVGTIGNAVVIEEDNKYHIQQNIAKLTPKKGTSPYFISQFLMSDLGTREVYRFNATSSQPNVLVGSLRKFELYIPDLKEQQKIADCLSSLDERIAAQVEKIEEQKKHKKGLLQGLFPVFNESTNKL